MTGNAAERQGIHFYNGQTPMTQKLLEEVFS
jgi:hypothetical protein